MDVVISELPIHELPRYATVPIAFLVTHRVRPPAPMGDGFGPLRASVLATPYVKDYDAEEGASPVEWPSRFDVRDWGLLAAREGDVVVGGAAVAPAHGLMPGVPRPRDAAMLWDLRVAPARRGRGVGAALFRAAERWAAARGLEWLVVETQDVNVPACRFYERQGCHLAAFDADAYPSAPGEARLVWQRRLGDERLVAPERT